MNITKLTACVISVCILTACGSTNSDENKAADVIASIGEIKENTTAPSKAITAEAIQNNASVVHYGIDISHYQGNLIDELTAKDSVTFVICKATQGTGYVDPDFRTNWNTIREKGYIRGAYHFYVCADDPLKQAAHFAQQIEDISATDIAPVLDIEQGSMTTSVSAEQMQNDILTFLAEVQRLTKRAPVLYTDYSFGQQYLKKADFAKYELWLADYTKAAQPLIPDVWKAKGCKIWQKSQSYAVDTKVSDLDEYKGVLTDLVK